MKNNDILNIGQWKKKCFTKYWKLKFKPHPFNAIYDNTRQNSIDKLRRTLWCSRWYMYCSLLLACFINTQICENKPFLKQYLIQNLMKTLQLYLHFRTLSHSMSTVYSDFRVVIFFTLIFFTEKGEILNHQSKKCLFDKIAIKL